MDLFRRILTLMNRSNESTISLNNSSSIPGYYLGQTYAAQPNSDELRRAAYILTAKTKKDIEKHTLPILSCCFERSNVVLRDGRHHKCVEFDIRKIVLSCVDAKNQRLLAIFYHNDSPFISGPMTARGLECHLFLCRSKEVAKSAANKIGEMLSEQYGQPTRPKIEDIDNGQVRLSRVVPADDYDYENISKFFRQKVFRNNSDYQNNSMLSTPYGSLSTCVTTNGCDSGRASTVASFDIRSDESLRSSTCGPINENDENAIQNPPSYPQSIVHLDRPENNALREMSNKPGVRFSTPVSDTDNKIIYKNRYSVHYDLEDDNMTASNQLPENDVKITIENDNKLQDHESYALEDISDGELKKLLDLSETDI